MMTRKDFQAFADEINQSQYDDGIGNTIEARRYWARTIASVCYRSNPVFKADTFYRACGLPEMADN